MEKSLSTKAKTLLNHNPLYFTKGTVKPSSLLNHTRCTVTDHFRGATKMIELEKTAKTTTTLPSVNVEHNTNTDSHNET